MKKDLETYIRNNVDELDRKTPGPAVLGRILEEMKLKRNKASHGILARFHALKWVAASVVVAVCSIALWNFKEQPQNTAITKIHLPVSQQLQQPGSDSNKQTGVNVVNDSLHIRKQAVIRKSNTKPVALPAGLFNMQSVASRITAVSVASRLQNNNNDVVDALIKVFNNDLNTNVRLAALDALTRFHRERYVRKKLVASLKKQQDPVVQITLIGLLTRMRERGILLELEKMINDENSVKAVKDCAYSGMMQLNS